MARIAVGGFQHETNTFAPQQATWDEFVRADAWPPLLRGPEMIAGVEGFNIPIAGAVKRPEQLLGLHFFNPPVLMALVEVTRGDRTAPETLEAGLKFVRDLGKTPVVCKDTPAFIVNRVARPFYGEALRLLGENAADPATIDALIKSLGFKMGPFELMDLIGNDINFAATESLYQAFFQDSRFRPSPTQQRLVQSGNLGRKTGRGFYTYGEK